MSTVTKHRRGHLFQRGAKGVYYLEYMLGGKRHKKALHKTDGRPITTRRDAEAERTRIMSPLTVADPEAVPPAAGPTRAVSAGRHRRNGTLNISEMWALYSESLNRPDSGPVTLAGYQSQVGLFVAWVGENHPRCRYIEQVSVGIAEAYSLYLLSAGSYPKALRTRKRRVDSTEDEAPTPKPAFDPNTFNKHITTLKRTFRVLLAKVGIVDNPWSAIMLKRENKVSRRELTVEELNAIINSAEGELQVLFLIGAYTGLRMGDACTLRWAEVDLVRRLIVRVPNKGARRKGKPVHIPTHPTLLRILAQVPSSRRKGYLLPEIAATYERSSSEVSRMIRSHLESCGIQVHAEGTGKGTGRRAVVEVGFHSLRHTFVSLCRAADAPLAVVEAIVGHSNPSMTRHYTHVGEGAATQAVAGLPSLGLVAGGKRRLPKKGTVAPSGNELLNSLRSMTTKNWRKIRNQLVRSISRDVE